MANAVQAMMDSGDLNFDRKDKLNQAIQYALDRLYMARISIHSLIAHHKSLYCPEERKINTRLQAPSSQSVTPQGSQRKLTKMPRSSATRSTSTTLS